MNPARRDATALSLLGMAHPVIQGPFGGGLSTPQLTATVSNLGGLGSYGVHHLAPADIGRVASDIRALTSQPFAMNLWVSDHDEGGQSISEADFERAIKTVAPYFHELGLPLPQRPERFFHPYADQVDALLEARPPVFSFVFGIPSKAVLQACRQRGIATIGAATSIAEAQALDDAGVDLIVATGAEAGGHRPSFLARAEDALMGTFALTQLVAARVKAPVISAGGIADARGLRAALALGAQAAQIGTAFLACDESGATPAHRDVLFSDAARQTVLTRTFTGRLARGVRNRWTDEMTAHVADLPPFPIQSWIVQHLKQAAAPLGRTDLVPLWSGQIAPNVRHRRAADLMDALISELR
jgi:nitronate monooxygenase